MELPSNALEERVYAFALSKELVSSYCNHCVSNMSELKKCSSCKKMAYCSQECQRGDWKLHKFECKAIKEHSAVAGDSIRLVMRIFGLLNKEDYGEVSEKYIPGGTRSFLTLLDHAELLDREAQNFVNDYTNYAPRPHPDADDLKTVFKKISVNSYSLSNSGGYPVGIALCIKLSAANHSCKPLTRVCYRNRTAVLIPVGSSIPKSLEGACHSYIDELMPRSMRQAALKKKYNFDCACEGCMDEDRNFRMEAYSCGNCGIGRMQNLETSYCSSCGWQMTMDHYALCQAAEQSAVTAREHLINPAIPLATKKDLCEKLIELFQDTLHKCNVHRIPILRCMFTISTAEQNVQGAINAGVKLLEIMTAYQSLTDPAVLYHKYQLGHLFLAAGANGDSIRMCQEIKEPLEKIYTKDSTVLRNIYVMIIKARNAPNV